MVGENKYGLTMRSFLVLTFSLVCLGVLYAISSFANFNEAANLIAPAAELLVAGFLFAVTRKITVYRGSWFLLGCSVLSYGLVDSVWALLEMGLGVSPDDLLIMSIMYLLPNLFLLAGAASFFSSQFHRWNITQMAVDLALILIILMDAFWVLFFKSWYGTNVFADPFALLNFLYLLTDLMALGLIGVFGASSSMKGVTTSTVICMIGILIYTLSDLTYCFQSYSDTYSVNNISDIGFVTANLVFGIAAVHRLRFGIQEKEVHRSASIPNNIKWRPIILVVLIIPFILRLLGVERWFDHFLLVLGVLMLHALVSGFLAVAVKSEYLLKREQEMNEQLEAAVAVKTADLIEANRELDILANRDLVTGLVNRRAFQEELGKRMTESAGNRQIVIFYMDLDRFKVINDSYGHELGDRILRCLGNRLEVLMDPGMLLARLGGDEFVVCVPGPLAHEEAVRLTEQLLAAFQEPMDLDPWQFNLSVSIGIACFPQDGADTNTLMKNADLAMYHAKAQGTVRYAFYSAWLSEGMRRRHDLEIALRKADFDKEFTLHYQPQFVARNRTLIGMEALLRWKSLDLGNVSPAEFIPVAEESGMILSIGDWVAEQALRRVMDWNTRFGLSLRMGINISPGQFDSPNFIGRFESLLFKIGVQPSWVDVEITESVAMRTETMLEEMLTSLTSLGVSISIDDFGTGYSSLSYIKRFDIDALKIAKPLVDELASQDQDVRIVGAIIQMAKSMRLRTIAEGVETEEQLASLQQLGCDEIQGFLLGRPVAAEQFESLFLLPAIS